MATTILQQSIQKAANNAELIEKLTEYISLQKKTKFQNQATAILPIPAIAKSSAIAYPTIDKNFVNKCERDLVYLIGPIANFIIKETLQSHPQISPTEFANKLAQNIPDTAMAIEFKQRILG